jgi:hypothetical protein
VRVRGAGQDGPAVRRPQELVWCAETLEAYDLTHCSDYPDTSKTRFKDISVRTGTTRPDITWTAYSPVNGCGQSAMVVSDSAVQGEVDISYRDVPTVRPWASVGGTFPDGAPVGAVAGDADHLDLFICGNDGDVYMNSWQAGDGWSSAKHGHWASIGGTFPDGAPLAAMSRTIDDMDVFICGNDGTVYTASFRAGDGWSSAGDGRWSPLGAVLPAGAPVTVVARDDDHLDLFATGTDGRVGTDSWRAGHGVDRLTAPRPSRRGLPPRSLFDAALRHDACRSSRERRRRDGGSDAHRADAAAPQGASSHQSRPRRRVALYRRSGSISRPRRSMSSAGGFG